MMENNTYSYIEYNFLEGPGVWVWRILPGFSESLVFGNGRVSQIQVSDMNNDFQVSDMNNDFSSVEAEEQKHQGFGTSVLERSNQEHVQRFTEAEKDSGIFNSTVHFFL